MADPHDKQPGNMTGKFYVDTQCIDCDVCRDTAPDFFTRNDDEGYSFVYRQPESPSDVEVCYEALQSCPVDAIGDDRE
jgi:ferredoxin